MIQDVAVTVFALGSFALIGGSVLMAVLIDRAASRRPAEIRPAVIVARRPTLIDPSWVWIEKIARTPPDAARAKSDLIAPGRSL